MKTPDMKDIVGAPPEYGRTRSGSEPPQVCLSESESVGRRRSSDEVSVSVGRGTGAGLDWMNCVRGRYLDVVRDADVEIRDKRDKRNKRKGTQS